jgi:hypothetical protein
MSRSKPSLAGMRMAYFYKRRYTVKHELDDEGYNLINGK